VAASTPQGSAQVEGQADGRVGDEVPNANGVADGVHVGAEGGKYRTLMWGQRTKTGCNL
jgi:hypothetical protein